MGRAWGSGKKPEEQDPRDLKKAETLPTGSSSL